MSDSVFTVFPSENYVDLCLYQFGREQCPPAHSFGPATRNHYLFHYVLSGTGKLIAADSKGQSHEYQIHHEEHDRRRVEAHALEEPQIQNGRLHPPLVHDEDRKQDHEQDQSHRGRRREAVRRKGLHDIEPHHQSYEQQNRALEVEGRLVESCVIWDGLPCDEERDESQRDVDEEDPVPRPYAGQHRTERRAQSGPHGSPEHDEGQRHTYALLRHEFHTEHRRRGG